VQPHQWACNPKNVNQQYEVIKLNDIDVRLKSKKSGLCLDVSGASKNNGAKVVQWTCGNQANQKWRIVSTKDGWYEIRAVHSNKCLDVKGGARNDGAKLQQWACANVKQQKFRVFRK
jgi:hypothetical protein